MRYEGMRMWGVWCVVGLALLVGAPAGAATVSQTTVVHAGKHPVVKKTVAKSVDKKITAKTTVKAAPVPATKAHAPVAKGAAKTPVNAGVKKPEKKTAKAPHKSETVKKAVLVVPEKGPEKTAVERRHGHTGSKAVAGVGAAAAVAAVAAKAPATPPSVIPVETVVGGPTAPLVTSGMPEVRGLAVTQQGPGTRVVMALTNSVDYKWFTLPQPARLVIDFAPEVTFVADPAKADLPDGSQVQALRAGRFRPGTVRMVIDLKNPAKINVRMLAAAGGNGPRLVVDALPPRGSEQATNVPPPADVVTAAPALTVPTDANEAPVVIGPARKNGKVVSPIEQQADTDAATAAPTLPVRPVARSSFGKGGSAAPIIVVLDPGHGGVDPGTHGRSYGTLEKNLTLAMARRVREDLQASWGDSVPPLKIIMTRDSDTYIPLPERVKIAQRANADLFVSLHADSAPDNGVTGATVYMVSDRGSDRESRRLAAQENSGDATAGIPLENESKEVQTILLSLVQRDTMNNSTYLGQNILKNVGDVTAVRKRNLMYAGFRVLEAADVPSVLVEMGYLSNPREEEALASGEHQKELAHAIAIGVRNYIQQYVHH